MARLAVVLLAPILAGCASAPGVYFDIGGGVKLNSSPVLRSDCDRVFLDGGLRSCGGPNPTGKLAVGFEFKGGSYCELDHFSHAFNGNETETYLDQVQCAKRFGGRNK